MIENVPKFYRQPTKAPPAAQEYSGAQLSVRAQCDSAIPVPIPRAVLADCEEVRTASRSVWLRTRWPPALPGCGVGMAERIHAGLRKMHLLLVVLLAPASQGAPGVCVEDVPDGLPLTCTAMDAATPALSCSTLYRMGYQCCPQCGPCGEHGSLCSSGSSGAKFFCITLLFLLVVWGFGAIVKEYADCCKDDCCKDDCCKDDCCKDDCCKDDCKCCVGGLFIMAWLLTFGPYIAGAFLVYLVVTFLISGTAGVVTFLSGSALLLAAAASLPCYLMIRSWCHDQQERGKHAAAERARADKQAAAERARADKQAAAERARADKQAAAERARAMLLKHGPAKAEEQVNDWQQLHFAAGRWQQFYFALRPHSGTTAAALLWWEDAEAFGEGSDYGGDPNNGKELGQFSLRGATLTCPPPSKRREPGTLFSKQVKRLELRRRDAQLEHELVLIFRVGKEDAAAAEWEAALRRALAPSAQQGASSAPPTSTPPPRIPVVTGTPVEPPRIEEKPAAAGKQRKALELV